MGDLNSGQLTLLAFAVLALFGVLAFFSLRRHIRGIQAPTAAELEASEEAEAPSSVDEPLPGPNAEAPVRRKVAGKRSPKVSGKS